MPNKWSPGSINEAAQRQPMPDDELRHSLDGLHAYDTGSVGSGIHDEALRQRCVEDLQRRLAVSMLSREASRDHRLWEARLLRDMWLSEEALATGYGTEDLVGFIDWLEERMYYSLR